MPGLPQGKLWPVQHEAIRGLEQSRAHGRARALTQMATGSGKTFMAVSASHRLIKHAGARRILFLVDRNNLGRQTLNEFQLFRDPSSPYTFADEFPVQRLRGNAIEPASKVVITTIQRLYSMLKGDPEFDPANEEGSLFESGHPPASEPAPVAYAPDIPVETFDFIVIDECHRSIYNVWRQVIEYFDAFLIGLTATPSPHTIGFFNNNVVQDYSHTKAVADGVNVGYDIYRIRTKISEEGGSVQAAPYVQRRDRRTRKKTLAELEDDLTYTATQLDRDVVAPDQIRLVVTAQSASGIVRTPSTAPGLTTPSHAFVWLVSVFVGSSGPPTPSPTLTDYGHSSYYAPMREITAKEAKNRFGQLLRSAQQGPVRVTRNGTPVGVMLSVEQFERLRGTAWDRLAAAMDAMSREAAAKGLTPAALESLLADES